ncbi:MAG TPA: hypothetical protein PK205_12775 [Promineifilum sp.]|nr:hypothetical protein [Promineifilum sp.]HRO22986.1 hypothetical protein [Promineifilum sp.]HRQ14172.1 hypothetical protein [Promineifilum sp.]
MAIRPIFVPDLTGFPYVRIVKVEFDWYPGFSSTQAQKSIASLHATAAQLGFSPVLEISSKSKDKLGVFLSAFNLQIQVPRHPGMSVECAFQGSKIFKSGGPYTDLYSRSSREAKMDERIRSGKDVIGFNFMGEDFPTTPLTAFYDWLYIHALWQNQLLADQLGKFKAFSDIAFNPKRSVNCQARSAALYVALLSILDIKKAIEDKAYYLSVVCNEIPQPKKENSEATQLNLPFKSK